MNAEEWQIVWFTAWVSALSTIIILPFGLGVAWLFARYDWSGKSLVETFISLPLAFARALGEFGATIMVAGNIPGKTSTLSLAIFQSVQLGQDANAFRLLGVSVVLAFAAVWWSEWLMRRRKH